MNKLKYLFIAVFCLGFIGGSVLNISAQTGGSARENADRLIEYYEWVFETRFTGDQRREYEEIKEEDFRQDEAGERKGIEGILKNFAIIKSKNENEQARIRGNVQNTFIKDLREMGSGNREASFLVSVYDGQQAADAKAAEANGTGDISAYVGKWVWAHTGTGLIVGGVYAGGNGSRYTYEFSPNGHVKFTGILNVMQGTCSQQVFQSREGRASVSGNNLTISWQPEKFTRDFSCDKVNNYTKTLPAKVEKVKVGFKTDYGQKQMCFIGAECFSETK